MISHEISWRDVSVVQKSLLCQWYLTKLCSWWDISVVEMLQLIQLLQLIQDNQVRLAHLWVDFSVIFFKTIKVLYQDHPWIHFSCWTLFLFDWDHLSVMEKTQCAAFNSIRWILPTFYWKKRFKNDIDGDSYSDIGTGSVIVLNTGFKPKSKLQVHLWRLYTVGSSELG